MIAFCPRSEPELTQRGVGGDKRKKKGGEGGGEGEKKKPPQEGMAMEKGGENKRGGGRGKEKNHNATIYLVTIKNARQSPYEERSSYGDCLSVRLFIAGECLSLDFFRYLDFHIFVDSDLFSILFEDKQIALIPIFGNEVIYLFHIF